MEIKMPIPSNKSLVDPIACGKKLRLRDGKYKQFKLWEWPFAGSKGEEENKRNL
jgi:hypothetical protein